MKLLFAGTPHFAAAHLEFLIASGHEIVAVLTQPDKPGKRGKKPQFSPVKTLAVQHDIPVRQPERLTLAEISDLTVDLMIVVAYGQILKTDVLDLPTYGCINVHASLLPRWRGAAPVQRAILAGDNETGVTLIQMDAGLDTGAMLAKSSISIDQNTTAASLFTQMHEKGGPLLLQILNQLPDVSTEAQNDEFSTYAKKIEKSEAGVDWQAGAIQVDRQVRAYNPEPIAFSYLGKLRTKIYAGTVLPDETGAPGTILRVDKEGVLVGCGDDAYLITRIQLPVGKGAVLKPADVMNGWSDTLKVNAQFTALPRPQP